MAGTQALPREAFHFLCTPLEATLGLPLNTKQQLVELVELAQKKKQKHEYGKYFAEQCFMEQWAIWW